MYKYVCVCCFTYMLYPVILLAQILWTELGVQPSAFENPNFFTVIFGNHFRMYGCTMTNWVQLFFVRWLGEGCLGLLRFLTYSSYWKMNLVGTLPYCFLPNGKGESMDHLPPWLIYQRAFKRTMRNKFPPRSWEEIWRIKVKHPPNPLVWCYDFFFWDVVVVVVFLDKGLNNYFSI